MPEIFIETNAEDVGRIFRAAARKVPDDLLEPAADKLGNEALRLYKGTTRSWSHQPAFEKIVNVAGGSVQVLVGTDDKIYQWVEEGTRAHVIEARTGGVLRFQPAYTPKTTPGSLQSRRGGSSGPFVGARRVRHPGTAARGFSELITKKVEKKASAEWRKAVLRWLKRRLLG